MLPKQVKYRGRWFPVKSETEDSFIIESWGKDRSVFKDEVIYEEPQEPKDVVSFGPTKDADLVTPTSDILPETPPEGKDLVQEAPKIEAGTYAVEIVGVYPDGNTTTYKVIFDIYGEHLEELNIQKITDVDVGGKDDLTPTLSPQELKDVENKINEKIKIGEIHKLEPEPSGEVDEKIIRTVQNPDGTPVMKASGPQMEVIPDKKQFGNHPSTRVKMGPDGKPIIGPDGLPEMEAFESVDSTDIASKLPSIGINTAPISDKERKEENHETIKNSLINQFKEEIKKIWEENFCQQEVPMQEEFVMTTELDSGKEYNVYYDVIRVPPEVEDDKELYIDVIKLEDTVTKQIVELDSLPFEEKQEILGAIAAHEDLDLELIDLAEAGGKPCWDGYEMIGMKQKDGKEVPNCVPTKEEIVMNEADKKKWKTRVGTKKDGSPKYVKHGHKDYKIAPGTSRGDSYCARSAGIKKDGKKMDCSGKDKNTPNCLSRRKWKCRGKKSAK
jgi:hypothetical protein